MKAFLAALLVALLALIAYAPTSSNALVAEADYTVETGVNGTLIYTVSPSTSVSVIAQIVAGLKAGDVLQFSAGVYVDLALDLTGLVGAIDNWIIIRGIPCGTEYPVLQLNTDVILSANVLLGLGSSFIKVEGLVFTQIGSGLFNGIQFLSDASNIILTNLVLNNINGIGIDISVDAVANVLIKHNVLSNIGLLSIAENLGVGILVGGILEPVTDVLNIQIIDNVIHDILGNAGSAIQVLLGVVAPQVLDNVIWNAPLGLGVDLDVQVAVKVVTGIADDVLANLPLVARNLIINTSGLNVGLGVTVALQIGAGSQVVNNIIVNADIGIDLVLGGELTVFINTLIAHNTVFNVTTVALRILDGLVSDTLVIVNNVLAVGVGLLGAVLELVEGILGSVAVILNNVVQGLLGVDFSGDLAGLLGTVEDLVEDVVDTVDDVVDDVVDVVDEVVDTVDDLLENLLGGVEGTLGGILGDVDNILGGLLGGIIKVDGSANGNVGLLGGLLGGSANGGLNLGGILGKRLPVAQQARTHRIVSKRGNYNGPYAFIETTLDKLFENVIDGVLLPVGPLLNHLVSDDLTKVVDQVGRVVDVLLEDVIGLVDDLVTHLQDLLEELGLDELADVLGEVKTLLDNLVANLRETVEHLVDGVEDVLKEVGDLLEGVVIDLGKVVDGVDDVLEDVLELLLGDDGLLGELLGDDGLLGGLLGGNDGLLGGLLGKKRQLLGLNLNGLLQSLLGGSANGGLLGGLLGGEGLLGGLLGGQDGLLGGLLGGILGPDGLLGGVLGLGGDGTGLLDVALNNVLGTVLGDLNNVLGNLLGTVDPILSGVLGNVNGILDGLLSGLNLDGLLSGLLADINLLLCRVLALVNNLLRSLLGGVIGHVHPLLGGILSPIDGILNRVLGGLLNGDLILTADVDAALNLVLGDLNKILSAVLSPIDLLLSDVLGLVDFNGNLRVGRFHIGALQAGVGVDFKLDLGFKSGAVVEVPCVVPTPGPSCPATRAIPIRSSA